MSSATLAQPTTKSTLRRMLVRAAMPALALVTAFVLGAVVIWITSGSLKTVGDAFVGLVKGALLKERGLSESLVATVPYILLSLAVAVGFNPACSTLARKASFTSARSARRSWDKPFMDCPRSFTCR